MTNEELTEILGKASEKAYKNAADAVEKMDIKDSFVFTTAFTTLYSSLLLADVLSRVLPLDDNVEESTNILDITI